MAAILAIVLSFEGSAGRKTPANFSVVQDRSSTPQNLAAHIRYARQTDLAERASQLVGENIESASRARQAGGGDAIDDRATAEDEIRAMSERREDIGTTADAAIDHHRHLVANRLPDRRQRLQGRRPAIELPPAVIGDDDPVTTKRQRAARIVRMLQAFDDELTLPKTPVAFEIGPALRRVLLRAHIFGDPLGACTRPRIGRPRAHLGQTAVLNPL